jgi:hypothetical protein
MKKIIIISVPIILILSITLNSSCGGGGSDCGIEEFTEISVTNNDFSQIIDAYNNSFHTQEILDNKSSKTNVYVDLSDGITKYALSDQNNKELFTQFFYNVQNEDNLSYYELSDDQITKYNGNQALSYFIKDGHKDLTGKLKVGAPLDKAFNTISSGEDLGIVVTDGELYDSASQQVSMNPWASDAFKSWFGKNGSLEIISTNFSETNSGKTYIKHMYLLIFMPSNYDGSVVELMKADFDSQGINYKSNSYSTNVSGLYDRDSYPDSQTPGTLQLNENGIIPDAYLDGNEFEYIDFTENAIGDWDDWFDSGQGIVAYTRDGQDPNTGKSKNFPLFEKLFIDLNKIDSYKVKNVKINVSNVTDNFNTFKKNFYATKNKPVIYQTTQNKDSLDLNNFLVFDECFNVSIDGEYAYDTNQKLISDTKQGYSKMLKSDFIFKSAEIDNEINDFIVLDNEEGMNNYYNGQKYEVVLKFDKKFDYDTRGFNDDTNNLVKIDVYVDDKDFELKPIDRTNLTWDKIDDSGMDQTLYLSLRNTLINNKPKSVLYTYYVNFGPFEY